VEHRPPLSVIEPGTYTIRVQGHLDATWSDRLGGMRITVCGTGRRAVTVLFGHHVDQAALLGGIQRALRAGISPALRRLSRAAVVRERLVPAARDAWPFAAREEDSAPFVAATKRTHAILETTND
jgi:hypothetical protein